MGQATKCKVSACRSRKATELPT